MSDKQSPIDQIRSAAALADRAIAMGDAPQELLDYRRELDQLLAPVTEAEQAAAASKARVAEARAKCERARQFEERTASVDIEGVFSRLFNGGTE